MDIETQTGAVADADAEEAALDESRNDCGTRYVRDTDGTGTEGIEAVPLPAPAKTLLAPAPVMPMAT